MKTPKYPADIFVSWAFGPNVTGLKEQNWQRKECEAWNKVFRGLAPAVRQQSVRVAAYAQVLYVQACANGFGTETSDGAERMRGQYGDLAYKGNL